MLCSCRRGAAQSAIRAESPKFRHALFRERPLSARKLGTIGFRDARVSQRMKRSDLSDAVQARLVRLPEPHQAHCGVVPAAPLEDGVMIGLVARRHQLGAAQLQGLGGKPASWESDPSHLASSGRPSAADERFCLFEHGLHSQQPVVGAVDETPCEKRE